MNGSSSADLALQLLPAMGLVIPAVTILVSLIVKTGYQAKARIAGLVSLFLVLVATILNILVIVYHVAAFTYAVGLFVASLIALIVAAVILIYGTLVSPE